MFFKYISFILLIILKLNTIQTKVYTWEFSDWSREYLSRFFLICFEILFKIKTKKVNSKLIGVI